MNSPPLSLDIAEEARFDIAEIGFYFAEQAPEVEGRFYQAFNRTICRLASSPNLGERCRFRNPKTKGMRVWQVDGFSNYLIFYRPKGEMLQVLRVIHGARDYMTIFENDKS
jgi:plasmid stabilization system protein ParE